MPPWMPNASRHARDLIARTNRFVGVDLDFESLRDNTETTSKIHADSSYLPCGAGTFSLVTANMVVEHLVDPLAFLRETARVLIPGGQLVFHTPNLLNYQTFAGVIAPPAIKKRLAMALDGRQNADIFRTYYRMNTPRRIAALAAQAGFSLDQCTAVQSTPISAALGPLVVPELLVTRLLDVSWLRQLRPNIIAVLRRP